MYILTLKKGEEKRIIDGHPWVYANEVAKIEGATGYETFWKVTFPMVMPHIITNVVYTIVDSFTESDVVDLAYDVAFTQFNYGLSSVFSLVSTVITCVILIAICGAIQKRTFYYN